MAQGLRLSNKKGGQPHFYLKPGMVPVFIKITDDLDKATFSKIYQELQRAWGKLPIKVRRLFFNLYESIEVANIDHGGTNLVIEGRGRVIQVNLSTIVSGQAVSFIPGVSFLEKTLAHEIYGHSFCAFQSRTIKSQIRPGGIVLSNVYKKVLWSYRDLVSAPYPATTCDSEYTNSERAKLGLELSLWVKAQLGQYPKASFLPDERVVPASMLLLGCGYKNEKSIPKVKLQDMFKRAGAVKEDMLNACPVTWQKAWLDGRVIPSEIQDIIWSNSLKELGADVTSQQYVEALKLQDSLPNAYSATNVHEALAETMVVELYHLGKELNCERATKYLQTQVWHLSTSGMSIV